ncbi:MAG: hypothetical protein AB7T86_10050 [Xanthobacteraceae bacterium]|uniref:hypothetical protein n=1 Tax=Pseudolabrys sp. TaxID=1960880 RepID=UPI003D1253D2
MAPYADISMRFKNGKLAKTATPAWFKKSIRDDGDWLQMLRQAGASEVADFDDGADSIHVLRREGVPKQFEVGAFEFKGGFLSLSFLNC